MHSLQVADEPVHAQVADNHFDFKISHPVDGEITARHPVTESVFSSNGIALRPISQSGRNATLAVHDGGGIYDPLDGRVPGEHYGASHFALLSAILFAETHEPNYLDCARRAIDFHLRTSPSEYRPMSEWMYHWDFQNYAFCLTYRLLQEHLSAEDRMRWQQGLKNWKTNHRNKLTNWAAMRAWAFAERRDLLGTILDSPKVDWNLRYVAKARSSDGCFDDNHNLSRPIQYHIFTVAILHRIHLLRPDARLKRWVADGIEYFLPFVDPDGDFNYLGRGHEQIFGYGAAIYALEAGQQENLDPSLGSLAGKLCDYLMQFQRGDHFPLVLNDRQDEERAGWYDYHHLTVYNAFLGAWLGLAHLLRTPRQAKQPVVPVKSTWISEPTQTAIYSKPEYFAAFYGGLPEYLCEGGITPHHLWWKDVGCIFSCPGGPTPDRFGKNSYGNERNFFAPIAKNGVGWIAPANGTRSEFLPDDDALTMTYDCGLYTLTRKVRFAEDAIAFEDEVEFLRDVKFEEFRLFNLPIETNKLRVQTLSPEKVQLSGRGSCLAIEFQGDVLPVEQLEFIESAKGQVQTLAKRLLDFSANAGDKRRISYRMTASE